MSVEEQAAAVLIGTETAEKIRASYPDAEIKVLVTRAGPVAVRGPTREEYKRYMAQRSGDSVVAQENLSKSCVLHPSPSELDALFQKLPGVSLNIANVVLELGGLEESPEVKKL